VIRQRFNTGRLSRIAAWALAAVTAMAAILNDQTAAAGQTVSTPDPAANDRSAAIKSTIPAAPQEGLLILRYRPTPAPPPPTIVRRVIVEERAVGSTGSAAPVTSRAAAAPAPNSTASAASPPPPLPAPRPLPAPAPVQSSGS